MPTLFGGAKSFWHLFQNMWCAKIIWRERTNILGPPNDFGIKRVSYYMAFCEGNTMTIETRLMPKSYGGPKLFVRLRQIILARQIFWALSAANYLCPPNVLEKTCQGELTRPVISANTMLPFRGSMVFGGRGTAFEVNLRT